jgi:Uma2 family endonuclease
MIQRKKNIFTPAEYLGMEEYADYKSEYYNGEIFVMAGGTPDHSSVAVSLTIELGQRLRGKPCRLFNSDVRLLIERSGLYTYPDAMVVCGKIQLAKGRTDTVTNPILIVEVWSESTRDYARGAKFNFYKQIPTLQEYVLVESEKPQVECFRRADGGKWTVEMYEGLDALARLESLECAIALRDIYDKVSWVD